MKPHEVVVSMVKSHAPLKVREFLSESIRQTGESAMLYLDRKILTAQQNWTRALLALKFGHYPSLALTIEERGS
jgi:hypothetical protein